MMNMVKNGLFLCSIGFLITIYSFSGPSQQMNVGRLIVGLAFVLVGGVMIWREKKTTKEDERGDKA
ncbi:MULTISPECIES: DUF3188 domain-containing protein [Enterococcus]|jgi:hypothetical protein|uniref:Uncharacterized protein n=2 Tax=Enterococcus dispar TaxID=44009 RepID=S0KM12_9ENTE|nr:DUF3188 domain-containing protein [Enterococcus dispar]EOT41063.1 hypothetical protein OMK_01232 [Enterococcus dispar ATCC 51266]EOW87303.1 hypothetical protein I569_02674 [Enterococcus dispar ATCC 51266]MCU7356369.1 DUF3188 domain-containing protein [Enterococcus dispar]WCG33658.1 DUF3188 domain-containing protein [Enterococcus dispar]